MWSNGKGLIPYHDFCAPADLTDDTTIITSCIERNNQSSCSIIPECKWRRGKQAPIDVPSGEAFNNQTDLNGRFFSKRFCHPYSTNVWGDNVESCMAMYGMNSCEALSNCTWSTARELVPPHDFCAPANMTTDPSVINNCVGVQQEVDCVDQC